MRRSLFAVTVALVALCVGAVVAGRPQSVSNDVRIGEIVTTPRPSTTSTTTSTTAIATTSSALSTAPESAIATTTPSTSANESTSPSSTTAPSTATPTTAGASTAPPTSPLVPEAETTLTIGNASVTQALATRTSALLAELGYGDGVTPANAISETDATFVYFHPGFDDEARRLATTIELAHDRVVPMPDEQLIYGSQESNILLLLGTDWAEVTDLQQRVPEGPADESAGSG